MKQQELERMTAAGLRSFARNGGYGISYLDDRKKEEIIQIIMAQEAKQALPLPEILRRAYHAGYDGTGQRFLSRVAVLAQLTLPQIEEHAEAIRAEVERGQRERKAQLWPHRYTTAPVDYDGFGTVTLQPAAALTHGKTIRKVAVCPEHLNWQESRYASGVHMCVDEAEMRKLVSFGLATFTPDEGAARV